MLTPCPPPRQRAGISTPSYLWSFVGVGCLPEKWRAQEEVRTKGALEQSPWVGTPRKTAKAQTDLPWLIVVRPLPGTLGQEARGGTGQGIYHLARQGPPLAWPSWGWGAELMSNARLRNLWVGSGCSGQVSGAGLRGRGTSLGPLARSAEPGQ